jgi:hypothetical protein
MCCYIRDARHNMNLCKSIEKCTFAAQELEYLDCMVTTAGICILALRWK